MNDGEPGAAAPGIKPVRACRAFAVRMRLPDVLLLAVLGPLFTVWFLRIDNTPTDLMHYIPFASARFAEMGSSFTVSRPRFPISGVRTARPAHRVVHPLSSPALLYRGAAVRDRFGAKAALAAFFDLVALGYVLLFYRVLSLVLNRGSRASARWPSRVIHCSSNRCSRIT